VSSNADLMKKGLRQTDIIRIVPFKRDLMNGIETSMGSFKRGPDEEGIETPEGSAKVVMPRSSNADLMKKGLRPYCVLLQRT
jgi:hypothetical protein